MNTIGKRYGVLAVCATLLIALDQWAKSMAYNTLRVNGPLVLIKGIFELLYSENRGAAFGMMQEKQLSFREPVSAALYFHGPSSFRRGRKPDRPCGERICGGFLLLQPHRFPDL